MTDRAVCEGFIGMYADEQVILLLKFALTIGPIAFYFLAIGFLNAQPRPQVLTGRADFLLLAVVFFPIFLWALMPLAGVSWVVLGAAAFICAVGFYLALPRRQSSWVVYNVTEKQFQRAFARAVERVGLAGESQEPDRSGRPVWTLPALGLRIRISPFSMLQNVTCLFERLDGEAITANELSPLRRSLQDSLSATHTLPSASAACFLLIGTVMLSAPLLLMARHMDAIVKVVSSLFA
ncbi:MAG: hypothetical protein PHU85_02425 [Phycisphaerae bacterium]|nr:hypothetical protein [Phycisphaerae bacterium]